jgi:hypothetical protein
MELIPPKKGDNPNYCAPFVIFQKFNIIVLNIIHTP